MSFFAGSTKIFYNFYAGGGEPGAGQGRPPALVLLHGLGASGDDWPLQLAAFSPHYRIITVDLRGHGRSPAPPGRWGIGEMAADVAALLEHLVEPPCHIAGLSLGGCAALQVAISRPDLVHSLVLANAFARLQPAGFRGALRFARRLWLLAFAPMPALAAMVARGLFPRPDQRALYEAAVARISANSKRSYWKSVRALLAFDARLQLGRVTCPTLVIAGDRDLTIPLVAKQRLAHGIPGARLVVVPDSGHATPYDQAEIFNRIVLDFLVAQT